MLLKNDLFFDKIAIRFKIFFCESTHDSNKKFKQIL